MNIAAISVPNTTMPAQAATQKTVLDATSKSYKGERAPPTT